MNTRQRLKLSVRHWKLLKYLNWNLGSAWINDKDARAQSAHYQTACVGPKTKKHHTDPRRPGDNSNKSFSNRTSKKMYIQNEIVISWSSEKPDYANSAKFR